MSAASRKLTLDDIADVRAYEREREAFRAHVVEVKARRRVPLGTLVTVLFENRDTIRFQVQEMARVERLTTDEAIQAELDVYNPMIPEPGQLRATLFIDLTSDAQVREWLPRLVGIQRHVVLRLPGAGEVRAEPLEQHEARLTREEAATSAVHPLRFDLTAEQVAAFEGSVALAVDHPAYGEEIELLPATVAELRVDLSG